MGYFGQIVTKVSLVGHHQSVTCNLIYNLHVMSIGSYFQVLNYMTMIKMIFSQILQPSSLLWKVCDHCNERCVIQSPMSCASTLLANSDNMAKMQDWDDFWYLRCVSSLLTHIKPPVQNIILEAVHCGKHRVSSLGTHWQAS